MRKECLATWLNLLDGVNSKQNIITIMTTNLEHTLDPALVRAGRIDYKLRFGYATEEQIKNAYFHFYENCSEEDYNKFYEKFNGKNVVMADVQNALLAQVR